MNFQKKKIWRHEDFLKPSKQMAATLYKWKKIQIKNAVFNVKTGETKQQVQRIKNKKVHLSIGNCYCERSTEIRCSRKGRDIQAKKKTLHYNI